MRLINFTTFHRFQHVTVAFFNISDSIKGDSRWPFMPRIEVFFFWVKKVKRKDSNEDNKKKRFLEKGFYWSLKLCVEKLLQKLEFKHFSVSAAELRMLRAPQKQQKPSNSH